MSITSVENKFSSDFTNFVISDFMIDSDDFSTAFPDLQKYSIKNTAIKINVIKFEEEKNHRVSSVTIFNKELFTEANEWLLLEKIEVDNCQVVILNEDKLQDNSLEDWLESCISMKELYNVSDDGKVCITSGFGPGIYRLMGFKMNDDLVAIRLEFIKEKVDENTT